MFACPYSPESAHYFLVPTEKSNSDPDFVRGSGITNGLVTWNREGSVFMEANSQSKANFWRMLATGRAITWSPKLRKRNCWNRLWREEQMIATEGNWYNQPQGDSSSIYLQETHLNPSRTRSHFHRRPALESWGRAHHVLWDRFIQQHRITPSFATAFLSTQAWKLLAQCRTLVFYWASQDDGVND